MNELPPFELFAEIYRRHGHRCPMSTLGGRLGFAARQRVDAGLPAESLTAVYHIATCALDGVRQATGCNEAAGSLTVREDGRHRLTLVDRRDGRGVVVTLRPHALALAGEYRRLDEELAQERPALAADVLAERLRLQEAFLDALLERLRTQPDEELMEFEPLCTAKEED